MATTHAHVGPDTITIETGGMQLASEKHFSSRPSVGSHDQKGLRCPCPVRASTSPRTPCFSSCSGYQKLDRRAHNKPLSGVRDA